MSVHHGRNQISGICVNKKGIKPDDDKVEVIRSMPEPKTVRQVRGFIGAIGYHRRFIPAFSRIATLLENLQRKVPALSGRMTASDHLIR